MAQVKLNGIKIGYDEAGAGPAVVFVHAGIADRRMWEDQFQELSADHRVIRYDWRGYGESDNAIGEIAHHEDLLGVMDALDVTEAVLVGCSMGGAYALDVALAAPDRVRALALICSGLSGHSWPSEMLEQVRNRVHSAVPSDRLRDYTLHRATRVRSDDVAAMAAAQARFMVAGPNRDPAQVDPHVWRLAVAMLERVFRRLWSGPPSSERQLQPPASKRLSEVQVPTLVITGQEDVTAIRDVSNLLSEGIPDARWLDLAGTAHLPPMEQPHKVNTALRQLLSSATACGH